MEVSPVSEEILINSTSTESRVALVDDGVLQEIWLERGGQRGYAGNIYKGSVCRVLPGMQAAFVDIGLERTGFLHVADIYRPETAEETQEEQPQNATPAVVETPPINSLVTEHSEIVVQVIKDPLGSKGARLTTNLSFPSRFLVLLPGCDTIGISARIEDAEERERLTELVRTLRNDDENCGYIVRTNAEGADRFALSADMTFLRKMWQSVKEKIPQAKSTECIHQDLSMPLKALRDLMHSEVEKVRIAGSETHQAVQEFVDSFLPEWTDRIRRHDLDKPVFDLYGIENEIDLSLQRHVNLKSGGHIVIEQTEAMTTIDVNTGAFVGYRTHEDTIYKTNLEASVTIARQLRLRNLGGIIIIDYIDMAEEAHQDQVLKTLEKALQQDRARTRVCGFSSLGLVEMTRKRITESLGHIMCEPCAKCDGRGHVKSAESVSLEVFREIYRSGQQFESARMLVMASPGVVNYMLDEQTAALTELENELNRPIRFQSEEQFNQEQFDVVLL